MANFPSPFPPPWEEWPSIVLWKMKSQYSRLPVTLSQELRKVLCPDFQHFALGKKLSAAFFQSSNIGCSHQTCPSKTAAISTMSSRSTEPQPLLRSSEGPADIRALPSYAVNNHTKGSICPDVFIDERDKEKSGRGRRINGLPRAKSPNPTQSQAMEPYHLSKPLVTRQTSRS